MWASLIRRDKLSATPCRGGEICFQGINSHSIVTIVQYMIKAFVNNGYFIIYQVSPAMLSIKPSANSQICGTSLSSLPVCGPTWETNRSGKITDTGLQSEQESAPMFCQNSFSQCSRNFLLILQKLKGNLVQGSYEMCRNSGHHGYLFICLSVDLSGPKISPNDGAWSV